MGTKDLGGWKKLVEEQPFAAETDGYAIPAYSEFMPPPMLGVKVYGERQPSLFLEDDLYGWQISEMEEEFELRPGLAHIAEEVVGQLRSLGQGEPAHHIAGHQGRNLADNPYWPRELAASAGKLPHERYLTLMPLALSRTQDDKGRVRWTFFGCSEQGPERAFWKGFYSAPGREMPEGKAISFLARLLAAAYQESADNSTLLYKIGFRILPSRENPKFPSWTGCPLPQWTRHYLLGENSSGDNVRYLLTFRPFLELPPGVQKRYLSGNLHLLPFPGSLLFWGMPTARRLQEDLPLGMQTGLCPLVARHRAPGGIRVPQSGWLHEPGKGNKPHEIHEKLLRNTFKRTSRWDRIHRHQDELLFISREEKVARVLFSTALNALGLYDKPMARNCQIWTEDYELLLDGPEASPEDIQKAEARLLEGGIFGYRFLFPAMRVGRYEVYWHRPFVAYIAPDSGRICLLNEPPTGYLTAYLAKSPDLSQPVELWPRFRKRANILSALKNFPSLRDHHALQTPLNILKLLETWRLLGQAPLPRSFARALLQIPKEETLAEWLISLPERSLEPEEGNRIPKELEEILDPADSHVFPQPPGEIPPPNLPPAITYGKTATRLFEEKYWRDIGSLAHGQYLNKNNADCVLDSLSWSRQAHHHRDLERLGDYLLGRHRKAIADWGMEGKAFGGDLPFRWETDFPFPYFDGWVKNQEGKEHERNLIVVIPGNNRKEAVAMADHYDTAYMENLYEGARGGTGPRLAAPGADDNYSATATLLNAASIFLELAKAGRLERDIWLLHLTGEEFPSDCLGARHFCQAAVEKKLRLRVDPGGWLDLSATRIIGVILMDMIAHNREDDRYVFQISPGGGAASMRLAYQAHLAKEIWNAGIRHWNMSPERHGRGPGRRSADFQRIPEIATHPHLYGEIRPPIEPRSSLFNTDGQIFSDVGIPVVLFMENYNINRTGYHDSQDTMENIDLDFGAAVAAVAIETVARVAML